MFAVKSDQNFPENQAIAEFDKKRERLLETVSKLANRKSGTVLRSGFTLADQVVTHAMVSAGVKFRVDDVSGPEKSGVQAITLDRYGLKLSKSRSDSSVSSSSLVRGWSQANLVQYVLDHEVPVDPVDMPGAIQRAA